MTEPTEREATVSRLIVRQLPHHLTLRARMREHVDEVEHNDVQRRLRTFELLDDTFAEITLVNLPIIKTFATAIPAQKRLNEFFLVLVFTLLVAFLHPKMRKHLLDLQR